MRYNTAVMALLKRMGPNPDAAIRELPVSLTNSLASSMVHTCRSYASAWPHEAEELLSKRRTSSSSTEIQYMSSLSDQRWGRMADQLPAFLLFLHLSRCTAAVFPRDSHACGSLLISIFYSVPRPHRSMQIYGLLCSMMLHLLPEDLRFATTAHLLVTFIAMAAARSAKEDEERLSGFHTLRRAAPRDPIALQNATVAEAVAALPSWMQDYCTLKDDTPLLIRLAEEMVRRLPSNGEGIPEFSVAPLPEQRHLSDAEQRHTDNARPMSAVLFSSSTTQMTGEELIMLVPKLLLIDSKHRKWHFGDLKAESMSWSGYEELPYDHPLYTDATADAIANAISKLGLVKNVSEVMAARRLYMNEWLFLVLTTASHEPRWRALVTPAARRALQIADTQRRERHGDAVEGTLFPQLSDVRRGFVLRAYIASVFSLRFSDASLMAAVIDTLPVLQEYVREMRRRDSATLSSLISSFGAMQATWVMTRILWVLEHRPDRPDSKISRGEGPPDAEWSDATGPLRAAGPSAASLEDDLLRAAADIVNALEECAMRGGYAETCVPSSPAASPSNKKRGSGFAKAKLPPASRLPERRADREQSESAARAVADITQLTVDGRMTYCVIRLRGGHKCDHYGQDLLTLSLRAMEHLRRFLASEVPQLTAVVQDALTADSNVGEYAVRRRHAERYKKQRLPASVLRSFDVVMHQAARAVRLVSELLRVHGKGEITRQDCEAALLLLAQQFEQVIKAVPAMRDSGSLPSFYYALIRNTLKLYILDVIPFGRTASSDTAAAAELTTELMRQRMQQLARVTLDLIGGLLNSSPHAVSQLPMPERVALARLTEAAASLGMAAGLTVEEMPHMAEVMRRVFEMLHHMSSEAREQQALLVSLLSSVNSNDRSNNARAAQTRRVLSGGRVLTLWSQLTYQVCAFGLSDEACIEAATAALRGWGTEHVLKSTPYQPRLGLLSNMTYIYRALSDRFASSHECRQLGQQILVVVARLSLERMAYNASTDFGSRFLVPVSKISAATAAAHARDLPPEEAEHIGRQSALLMWQLACVAVLHVGAQSTTDKHLGIILQNIKRRLVVPGSLDTHAVPQPMTAEHLQLCESTLQRQHSSAYSFSRRKNPTTHAEAEEYCNAVVLILTESAKRCCVRITWENVNGSTPAQRKRWQSHMEVFCAVVLRHQAFLAPSLWSRVVRDCIAMSNAIPQLEATAPLIHETLVLGIDRILHYAEAHNNQGSWWETRMPVETGALPPVVDEANEKGEAEEAPSGQLITYQRVVRLFGFQQSILDMDRRAYLVRLTDELVRDMETVEFLADDATTAQETHLFSRQNVRDEWVKGKPADWRTVHSARTRLLISMRKLFARWSHSSETLTQYAEETGRLEMAPHHSFRLSWSAIVVLTSATVAYQQHSVMAAAAAQEHDTWHVPSALLVLVTGLPAAGKTSFLAAAVQYMTQHQHQQCTVFGDAKCQTSVAAVLQLDEVLKEQHNSAVGTAVEQPSKCASAPAEPNKFEPLLWKRATQQLQEQTEQSIRECLCRSESEPAQQDSQTAPRSTRTSVPLIFVEDNMHYRSMRARYYRLCRRLEESCPLRAAEGQEDERCGKLPFIAMLELRFSLPLAVCLERNVQRAGTALPLRNPSIHSCAGSFMVPPSVLISMDALFDRCCEEEDGPARTNAAAAETTNHPCTAPSHWWRWTPSTQPWPLLELHAAVDDELLPTSQELVLEFFSTSLQRAARDALEKQRVHVLLSRERRTREEDNSKRAPAQTAQTHAHELDLQLRAVVHAFLQRERLLSAESAADSSASDPAFGKALAGLKREAIQQFKLNAREWGMRKPRVSSLSRTEKSVGDSNEADDDELTQLHEACLSSFQQSLIAICKR